MGKREKFKRNWDEVAHYEDGYPLTYRDLANEELSQISPLTKEYLEYLGYAPLSGRKRRPKAVADA
jgi:hypothetical protein